VRTLIPLAPRLLKSPSLKDRGRIDDGGVTGKKLARIDVTPIRARMFNHAEVL
jgi:hypothetical protein